MKIALAAFVLVLSLFTGCVVSSSPPPGSAKPVPPGQVRSERVHERNEERKAEKDEEKREKKVEKDEKKGGKD
jgi:hypothetical protein